MFIAIFLALGSSIMIGLNTVIVKMATSKLDPLLVNFIKTLTASFFLLFLTIFYSIDLSIILNFSNLSLLFLTSLIGPTLAWYSYIFSLRRGHVSIVHPIANLYPLIAMIIDHFIFRSIIGFRHILSFLLTFTGAILVMKRENRKSERFSKSTLIVFIPTMLWGINVILFKILTRSLSSIVIATMRAILASTIMMPFTVSKLKRNISLKHLGISALAGILGDVISFNLWITAIGIGPIPLVMPIISSSPIFSAIFSHMIFSERIPKRRVLGIIFAVVGIALLSLK